MNSVYRYSNIAWPLRPETPQAHPTSLPSQREPRAQFNAKSAENAELFRLDRFTSKSLAFSALLALKPPPVPQPAAVFLTLLGAVAIILARKG